MFNLINSIGKAFVTPKRQQARPEKQPFQFEPLEPDTIRLFRVLPQSTPDDIHCTLYHQTNYTADTVKYHALSYCWGDPTPVAHITLNGDTFPVANNLLQWLQTRSVDPDENSTYIWVDAVCINQTDIPERNAQVQQMWRIYANASMVIAWLGMPDGHLTTVFGILKAIEVIRSDTTGTYPEPQRTINEIIHDPEHAEAIKAFWILDYWKRLWIVPEILNAKNICVQTSRKRSNLDHVANLVQSTSDEPSSVEALFFYRHMADQLSSDGALDATSFMYNMGILQGRGCADPRDNLFVMASLPDYRNPRRTASFVVDYNMSNEEVCAAALSYYSHILRESRSQIENPEAVAAELPLEYEQEYVMQVIKWFVGSQGHSSKEDVERYLVHFREWLKERVVDESKIVVVSGQVIDCSGGSLARCLSDETIVVRPCFWGE